MRSEWITLGELLVHKLERLGHLAAPARQVLLAEDVDQLLRDALRDLRVFRV